MCLYVNMKSNQTMNQSEIPNIRRLMENLENRDRLRWEGIELKKYDPNQEKSPNCFKDITRQVFFGEAEGLPCELRYFEMGRGGHSTLERHHHVGRNPQNRLHPHS